MIEIKVLGTGCSKCKVAESQVKRAIDSLNRFDIILEKIDRIEDIMRYNIMSTPAIVINGVVKLVGRVPSVEQILHFIQEAS